jgi:hypothetical protein
MRRGPTSAGGNLRRLADEFRLEFWFVLIVVLFYLRRYEIPLNFLRLPDQDKIRLRNEGYRDWESLGFFAFYHD